MNVPDSNNILSKKLPIISMCGTMKDMRWQNSQGSQYLRKCLGSYQYNLPFLHVFFRDSYNQSILWMIFHLALRTVSPSLRCYNNTLQSDIGGKPVGIFSYIEEQRGHLMAKHIV